MSHSAFLRAILDDPDNDAPRLVYADWLDEQGDYERAEFIRQQIALAEVPWHNVEFILADKRFEKIIERNRAGWEVDLPKWIGGVHYGRGLPNNLWCRLGDWLEHGAEAFDLMPLETVGFDVANATRPLLQRYLRSSLLGRLKGLSFWFSPLTADDVRTLTENPNLSKIRTLEVHSSRSHGGLDDQAAFALAQARNLHGLEELNLSGNRIGPDGFAALVTSPELPNLCKLNLALNPLDDAGIEALTRSKHRFKSLELVGVELSDRGVETLCDASCAVDLRDLNLSVRGLTAQGVRAVARSLANLECLTIDHRPLGDEGAQAIADTPFGTRLRRVKLPRCRIGPKGCAALAQSAALRNLTDLDLSKNRIGDEGLVALAESPVLRNLRDLKLDGNSITAAGVIRFSARASFPHLLRLSLNDNLIDDRGVGRLAASRLCANLAVLNLHGNALQGPGPAALAGLTNLKMLHLAGNHLEDSTALYLHESLAPDCYLTLHGNRISADVWARLIAARGDYVRLLPEPWSHDGWALVHTSYDQMTDVLTAD